MTVASDARILELLLVPSSLQEVTAETGANAYDVRRVAQTLNVSSLRQRVYDLLYVGHSVADVVDLMGAYPGQAASTFASANAVELVASDAAMSPSTGIGAVTKAAVVATGLAAVDIGAAQALIPTAVKTANYTAAAGDFVPVDASGGSAAVTLPTAPPDKTRIGVKAVTAPGANAVSLATGGSDVFNKAGGSTSLTLSAQFQGALLQYQASTHIWYVTALESPLGVAAGAAKLGTDGTVGGPGGSGLTSSVASVASAYAAGLLNPASSALSDPLIKQLKRDILLLDNGANGNGATNSIDIIPEQFIPDGTTGAMYLLYMGNGSGSNTNVCIAKATGTQANPASPDPTVNAFTDLGPLKASGANIQGDAPHIVIANGLYFLFYAQTQAQGSGIMVRTAPQTTGGAIVPLENAVWSAATVAAVPAPTNVRTLAGSQGGAGSLPNALQTLGVTARDADGIESGYVPITFTPTASSSIVLTWVAPLTGETAGYYVYLNGARIATIAHGTLTYTVTGAEALGVAPPAYNAASCTRLDEAFVFFDATANLWRMVAMGFDPTTAYEQTHLLNLAAGVGITAMTSGVNTFTKQSGQPIIPGGNYAAKFGTAIPGGAANATVYDWEGTADPFVFTVGKYFVIGYTGVTRGAVATSGRYTLAFAVTTDFVTVTKLGVFKYASAAKNPADATNGVALANGKNRTVGSTWRGSIYVDSHGIGHLPLTAYEYSGSGFHRQAYYNQLDLSGLPLAILGVRQVDPWVSVEAEAADPRLTRTGFATTVAAAYFSGGAVPTSTGSVRTSAVPGDQITFTFNGSAVRVLMGRISSSNSTVDVLLDGGGTEGVNQFTAIDMSTASATQSPIFAAQFDGLIPGVHTLTVRVNTATNNGAYVDRFDYIPAPGLVS